MDTKHIQKPWRAQIKRAQRKLARATAAQVLAASRASLPTVEIGIGPGAARGRGVVGAAHGGPAFGASINALRALRKAAVASKRRPSC